MEKLTLQDKIDMVKFFVPMVIIFILIIMIVGNMNKRDYKRCMTTFNDHQHCKQAFHI